MGFRPDFGVFYTAISICTEYETMRDLRVPRAKKLILLVSCDK